MMSYDQMWGSRPHRSHDFGFTPYNEANKVSSILYKVFAVMRVMLKGQSSKHIFSTGAILVPLVPRYDSILPMLLMARRTGSRL